MPVADSGLVEMPKSGALDPGWMPKWGVGSYSPRTHQHHQLTSRSSSYLRLTQSGTDLDKPPDCSLICLLYSSVGS